MANITAADVKKLRELTGAGMMDCKNALADSGGDLAKAVELLRIKGAKDVNKRAERTVANGLVAATATGGTGGTMIELNCETDFVAKSADFQALAARILDVAAARKPADLDELSAARLDGTEPDGGTGLDGGTIGDAVEALSARIGEKVQLRRAVHLAGPVALYSHRRAADLPPAIGVLVAYTGPDPEAAEAARAVAMHIAAARPRYVTREEIPDEVVAHERRIAEATAREGGKPEAALPKIVEGRLNGFMKDVVLLEQPSVHDAKKTVGKVLDEAGVTVTGFARFEVGQG